MSNNLIILLANDSSYDGVAYPPIEDIDEYRFLENGKKIKFIEIPAETLSVDTSTDLQVVRSVIQRRIDTGEIIL